MIRVFRILSNKATNQYTHFYQANKNLSKKAPQNRLFSVFNRLNNLIMNSKGVKGDWSLKFTGEEVTKRTVELIKSARTIYDSIAALPDDQINYENFLKVLADTEGDFMTKKCNLDRVYNFSPDKEVCEASTEAEKKFEAFDVEISMRIDIFNKLLILEKQKDFFEPEAKRYIEKLILYGKRNGLHLSEDIRNEVKNIKTRISELSIQMLKNCNDEDSTFYFTKEDLKGLPEDFLLNRKVENEENNYKVTLKYPDITPILEYCRVPETRRQIHVSFNSRCKDNNSPIMAEILILRHKMANLLGYPTHVDYKSEVNMSKSKKNIEEFLMRLSKKLQPLWEEERKQYLSFKQQECSELNIPFDGDLQAYDLAFYSQMLQKKKYNVDNSKLKEYFPLPVVTSGLLEIYQVLLGLKFEEVKNPVVWHEDVQMFQVEDSITGELMGYFYLDCFPRKGKYSHAANFDLEPGFVLPDGSRQIATVALVMNFPKPEKDKPSLLDFQEVVTFFHEFGHCMHFLCSKNGLAHFNAFNTEHDFIEVPSIMLENWCWNENIVKKMSSHYLDKSAIPDDLLKSLIKSRHANSGLKNLRQIIYALTDFRVHTCAECDSQKVFSDVYREFLGIDPPKETHMICSFMHLFNGYDAGYYTYLWGEVYSADMYSSRFKNGKLLDPATGMQYRKKVLEPGSTKDAMDLVIDFLGHPPTEDAFLKSKGL